MLRIDGRVLAGSVLGLFLVGAAVGFFVGGGFGSPDPATGGAETPTVVPPSQDTPAPTPSPSPSATSTRTPQPSSPTTPPPTATVTATPTPVPTPQSPRTVTAPAETRTPMLIRRFSEREIRDHLARMINEWRERRGLPTYRTRGKVASELRVMANNHSIEMADAGVVTHKIDGRSSIDRYRQYKLDQTCRFRRNGEDWIVTPRNNRFELVGMTYAGQSYVNLDGTRQFNEDERAVAAAVFDDWMSRFPFRHRLKFHNTTHIGIGVETTSDNGVYVTANLCGVAPTNRAPGSS